MSWIVGDVIDRIRADIGPYHRREWRQFLTAIGLRYTFDYLPRECDAVLFNGLVIFRNGLTEDQIIDAAYHEAGHHLTVAGDVRMWRSRLGGLQGDLTVARFEYRANLFAELFPIREDAP